jgi:hypothetical protein
MKNKKLQFEKLKNKLKNIFFKKLLQVVNTNPKLNLVKDEYPADQIDINSNEKIKESKDKSIAIIKNIKNKDLILSNNEKIINLNKIIISKGKEKNLSKISLQPNKLDIANKDLYKKEKILSTNSSFKQNLIHNKTNTSNNFITKNFNVNKKNVNKTFNLFKSYNIKLLQKPNEIKNLKLESVNNQNFELDNKDFTIPSITQLKILKNKLKLNRADINQKNISTLKNVNIKEQKLKEKIKNISQHVSNKKILNVNKIQNNNRIFNFSTLNPINIDKNKILYALPAYQEGTNGPISTESIGKIHAGEMILNKKESASFSKNLMKTELSTDLKIKRPSPDLQSEQESTPKLEANSTNEFTPSSVIPMDDTSKLLAKDKLLNSIPSELNKPDILIKEKIDAPLFLNSVIKKQSLPPWRTTVG